ncbi:MAG: TMEM165/GDT1 family protein [Acidimicrobiales bacterium]
MSIRALLQAFATVFPAELPDKTMVATIVLVTRYRTPLPVWIGAVLAFSVHVVVAVAAGTAISLLPKTPVQLAVAALFLIGAALLFREGRRASPGEMDREVAEELGDEPPAEATSSPLTAVAGSFALIIVAEWGDLTQLATASLAAKSGDALATGVGALAALASVAGIAATFGRQLVARVPIWRINYIGAAVFAALAVWTLVELA